MGKYSSLIYDIRERPVVRYTTGNMVYEECMQNGRFISLYWSATGYTQREDLMRKMKTHGLVEYPLHTFELVIDGQSLNNRWKWLGGHTSNTGRDGIEEVVVELEHTIRPVRVKVITSLDGSSVMARRLEITNTGNQSAALSYISPMCGLLWENSSYHLDMIDSAKARQFSLGYFKAQDQGEEGNFVWQPLNTEILKIENLQRKPFGNPYFIVKNEATGEMFFISLAWSAGYFAEFKFECRKKSLLFKMGPSGPAPLRVIGPGETICSPAVHIGPLHCGIDEAVEAWYDHLRKSVIPPKPADKQIYANAGRCIEDPGEWILKEVDMAAEMGAEEFTVDAGWFGKDYISTDCCVNRGDWYEADYLPGKGLSTIRERIHERGMLFGLWMEPETMDVHSQLLQNHPDWRVTHDGLEAETVDYGCVVDLSIPEAANYIESAIIRAIRDYKLDYFKLDYNMYVYEGGQRLDGMYAENQTWRHHEVLYGIFDRVLKEYPHVLLENCASGGGRNDLGMLARFHCTSHSDWSLMPFSIRAINGLTLFIPPESITYYHSHVHFAHQLAELETHLRVTLFAMTVFTGFGGQDADMTGNFYIKTKEYIELSKGFCRPVMSNSPRVFHHTPYIGLTNKAEWCVLEYADRNNTRGYAGVFRIGNDDSQNEYLLRLRGVDISKDYEVTSMNRKRTFKTSGERLTNEGLTIHLEDVMTSELFLYKAI